MNQETPDFRATIARGRITLAIWHPSLMRPDGPCELQFRQRERAGVVVADLTILRHPDERSELVVDVLSGELQGDAERTVVEWASSLGYGRIWLPGALIEPPAEVEFVGGRAQTRCTACRTRWENEAFEFWSNVRGWGHFPLACPLCGIDLPQWTVRS